MESKKSKKSSKKQQKVAKPAKVEEPEITQGDVAETTTGKLTLD
jgi:hypothetical protein